MSDDCSAMRHEQLEMVCREMWTAVRGGVGAGEGKPGDAWSRCTPDVYGPNGGGGGGGEVWGAVRIVAPVGGCGSAGWGVDRAPLEWVTMVGRTWI